MSETRRHWSTETAQYGLKIYHLRVRPSDDVQV